MILKTNDTPSFNISLELSVDCEAEIIELTVITWDMKNNAVERKNFSAGAFSAALLYFKEKETEAAERKERENG